MKAQNTLKISILAGLLILSGNTASGAKVLAKKVALPIAPQVKTPELAQADERVKGCKTQLDTAKKQLHAARALLKAAEADLKAAEADREALALRTTAQTLADASGLQSVQQGQQAPVAAAQKPVQPAQAPVAAQVPVSQPADTASTRIQPADFNAETTPSDPLPLR